MKTYYFYGFLIMIWTGCATFQSKVLTATTQSVIQAVRAHCSESMEVSVEVQSAKLSDRTGRGELKHVSFGNPEGYLSRQAVQVKKIKLNVVPDTLNEKVVVIDKLVIEEPEITYELQGGVSNLEVLYRRTAAYIEKYEKNIKFGETVIIRNLHIQKGVVHFSHDWLGGEVLTFPFPDLHLTGLELGEDGLTPAELTVKLTQEFIGSAENIIRETALMLQETGQAVQEHLNVSH